jgi:Asp-tRNA(Asn)/Glu-tRNA(Gln) amidotransferase A subunit family amidase
LSISGHTLSDCGAVPVCDEALSRDQIDAQIDADAFTRTNQEVVNFKNQLRTLKAKGGRALGSHADQAVYATLEQNRDKLRSLAADLEDQLNDLRIGAYNDAQHIKWYHDYLYEKRDADGLHGKLKAEGVKSESKRLRADAEYAKVDRYFQARGEKDDECE